MSETNTGGPAFPNAAFGSTRNEQQGMALRDYFAAKAMQGLIADPSWQGMTTETMVATAYEIANAMLKERGSC